jgi:hypothetical protein
MPCLALRSRDERIDLLKIQVFMRSVHASRRHVFSFAVSVAALPANKY